eukprot:scaffold422882_cov45-Prasinocladus_malaysianus.AAC.1
MAVATRKASALLAVWLASLSAAVSAFPEQVRLSLVQKKEDIIVTWVTPYWAGTSFVQYGENQWYFPESKWTQENSNYGYAGGYGDGMYARSVRLQGLKADTKYYYKVGNDKQGWSK